MRINSIITSGPNHARRTIDPSSYHFIFPPELPYTVCPPIVYPAIRPPVIPCPDKPMYTERASLKSASYQRVKSATFQAYHNAIASCYPNPVCTHDTCQSYSIFHRFCSRDMIKGRQGARGNTQLRSRAHRPSHEAWSPNKEGKPVTKHEVPIRKASHGIKIPTF